jgi:hypothetical protein
MEGYSASKQDFKQKAKVLEKQFEIFKDRKK